MIINSDKKIICVKDIPSNLIDEAIFILKPNMIEKKEENEEKSQEVLLLEAEDIVEEYLGKMNIENDEEYCEDDNQKKSLIKEVVYVISILAILAICIFIVM